MHRSPNLIQSDMPPGSLVTLLQKALLFLYVETHVSSDGAQIPCDEPFSLFKPHDHDHGPIDAPLRFEEANADESIFKRSESVNREVEESASRQVKKSKGATKEKREAMITSNDIQHSINSEVHGANIPRETESAESKTEAMDIEPSISENRTVLPTSSVVDGEDERLEHSSERKESAEQKNEPLDQP